MTLEVGQQIGGVEIGPVAHGGHFVTRYEGQVIFVRGTDCGEVVDVRITEVTKRFARAEVTAVRQPSAHRVISPCPVSDRCGGCDFLHLDPAHSRELKRRVVAEQLAHLGGYEFPGDVENVDPAPLGWRMRMRYVTDDQGQCGLRAYRSSDVVSLSAQGCLIAAPSIAHGPRRPWTGSEVLAAETADGPVFGSGEDRDTVVEQRLGDRVFQVTLDGFWQAHQRAPEVLTQAVIAGLEPRGGETAADLYGGVGLFAGALVDAGCQVVGVEGNRKAVQLARRNVPQAAFAVGDVATLVSRLPQRLDLVVLDPPRAGASSPVLEGLAVRRPRRIAYVACDPAALGRDIGRLSQLGYQVWSVQAWDLFPMTHHVEALAVFSQE